MDRVARYNSITARLSDAERKQLDRMADRMGVKPTVLARFFILDGVRNKNRNNTEDTSAIPAQEPA